MTRNDFSAMDNSHALIGILDLVLVETLTGTRVMTNADPSICKFDPGGANRDVTLDAVASSKGKYRRFINAADAAENLVVKNVGGSTIVTVNQNEQAEVWCDGTDWILLCVTTIALS